MKRGEIGNRVSIVVSMRKITQICFIQRIEQMKNTRIEKKKTYEQEVHQHVTEVNTIKGLTILINRVQEMNQQVIVLVLVLLTLLRIRMTLDLLGNRSIDNRHQHFIHILDLLWELPCGNKGLVIAQTDLPSTDLLRVVEGRDEFGLRDIEGVDAVSEQETRCSIDGVPGPEVLCVNDLASSDRLVEDAKDLVDLSLDMGGALVFCDLEVGAGEGTLILPGSTVCVEDTCAHEGEEGLVERRT